jgi:hypothetical protein
VTNGQAAALDCLAVHRVEEPAIKQKGEQYAIQKAEKRR